MSDPQPILPDNNEICALFDVDLTLFNSEDNMGFFLGDLAVLDEKNAEAEKENIELKIQNRQKKISDIKKKMYELSRVVLNGELMAAARTMGIKHVYLFTDMKFGEDLEVRQALVEILQEQGFQVHAVITPLDLVWNLSDEDLAKFHKLSEAQGYKVLDQKESLDLLEKNQWTNKETATKPGQAFIKGTEEYYKADEKKTIKKGDLMKSFLGIKRTADSKHENFEIGHKDEMFQLLLKSNEKKFKNFILFDDRQQVLDGVTHVAQKEKEIRFQVIHVNNRMNGVLQENRKTTQAYIEEIRLIMLRNACEDYEEHLEKKINAKLAEVNGDEYKAYQDPNFRLAKIKLRDIQEIHNTLKGPVVDLDACAKKVEQHRAELEKNRDHAGITFLKIVATIFSLGAAWYFGMWQTRGEKTLNQMEPLLQVAKKPKP